MVVVCLMPPHSNHLIRLYSCLQNRFQISAKCFGNAFSVSKKITKNSSANDWRNCPHQIIFSPAAQYACINTKQKWWPAVWPRLQWYVFIVQLKHTTLLVFLLTDQTSPEVFQSWASAFSGFALQREACLWWNYKFLTLQLVGTSDFLKTCNFQDCTIK